MISAKNIFDNPPFDLKEEFIENLISNDDFKLERIVSDGHASSKGFWYNQLDNEFVLLLKGSAEMRFEDGQKITLHAGDYFIIPKHHKHRIEWTDPSQKTIWLTLHY